MADSTDDIPPTPKSRKEAGRAKSRSNATGSNSRSDRLATIEQLLIKSVEVVKDGEPTKMSALEAMLYRLVQKSVAGDRKAEQAIHKFEEFALQHSAPQVEIVFVDNEYTKAFAKAMEDGGV